MSSEEDDNTDASSSDEEENASNSDNENSDDSDNSEKSDDSDSDDSDDDDDAPKQEPLPPLPKFERRKRAPPNPDIPWVSAIPLANELDELKTRIKQLEFTRDQEINALEEQLQLAETEAIESAEKYEKELQATMAEREKLIKERDSLSSQQRKLERTEMKDVSSRLTSVLSE
eukprot:g4871.t1